MDAQDPSQTVPPAPLEDEDDTEGQAFKWQIVDDPKSGKQLRQGWTPDDQEPARSPRGNTPAKGKTTSSR